MWCEYKSCSCKHAKQNGYCAELSRWASCEIPNNLEYTKIPFNWIKQWAKDNSNGEWSAEYRTIFNGMLKDWEKYHKEYTSERDKIIKEKENEID